MEYLERETLAERLKKGPLAPDQVLRYAEELPDALGHCASGGRSPHYFILQYHFRSRTSIPGVPCTALVNSCRLLWP